MVGTQASGGAMDLATQNHLHTLRELLLYRQSALHGRAQAARNRPAPLPTDNSSAQEQELAAVEAALHRLDVGRYGDCLECGDAIPWARLLAQPAAERCAACQSVWEQEH